MATSGPSWSINKKGEVVGKNGKLFQMTAPLFPEFTKPQGFLDGHAACQALWYYAVLIKGQKAEEIDPMKYDDEWPFRITNSKNLFMSIAQLYKVTPDEMLKFWPNVDTQCAMMGSRRVHADLRHDKVAEIKTQ